MNTDIKVVIRIALKHERARVEREKKTLNSSYRLGRLKDAEKWLEEQHV